MIAAIIICASIVIGVLGQTGLGVKITSLILSVSGDMLWPALLLTAIACLILGMEVPTTAAYVICISVAGPALQQLGLPPLQAHLFVFGLHFSRLSRRRYVVRSSLLPVWLKRIGFRVLGTP